jgi:nucleotide-binding universal stress UspA family protein
MAAPVLVGVDGSGDEAPALGRLLASISGEEVMLGAVYGYESLSPPWPPREQAVAWIAGARREPDESGRLMLASSVADGLEALAARENAGMLVLGPSPRGPLGRLLAGSTAQRVIHGAPCAVVVAPRGWTPPAELRTILVAVDEGSEATAALAAAAQLAAAGDARLQAVNVVRQPSPAHPLFSLVHTSYTDWASATRAAAERIEQDAAAATGAEPEIVIAEGDPAARLAELSRDADLLVVGSRRYGPLRTVLLGGVSWPLLERAACPVLVVPRALDALGADVTLSSTSIG